MKPTAKDANNITIPAWDLVVEGRQIYIAAPTDVNIQSGSQGQKRRDLIVARYALNSGTGVETVTLEAIKGKPSAATPADPGIETGSIIGGAIVSDLPLCRVNLDGITITSIDTLVNVMQPLEDVWDSLTPVTGQVRMPYSDRYITLVRVGRIVTACAYITLTSNFTQVSNVSVNETIPKGFRPSGDSRAVMRGTDNSGATSFYLYGTPEGKMVLNGTGYTSRFVGISGCWITA